MEVFFENRQNFTKKATAFKLVVAARETVDTFKMCRNFFKLTKSRITEVCSLLAAVADYCGASSVCGAPTLRFHAAAGATNGPNVVPYSWSHSSY